MKNLLIVGARGWGREVYASISKSKEIIDGEMVIKGFLDSKSDAFEGLRGTFPPIISSPENYELKEDDIFFVALGDSKWRKHYAELLKNKGAKFYTYIADESFINETSMIGEGSYVARWCAISDNVTIGEHVIVHPYTNIGHDAVVKDYASLLTNVFIGGAAEVGESAQMSPQSMIIPHKKIGKNVMVGAGSVVIRNIKDGQSVHGNPAIKLKF